MIEGQVASDLGIRAGSGAGLRSTVTTGASRRWSNLTRTGVCGICAARPLFGTDFNDKAAFGHSGSVPTVMLFDATRIAFERGKRRERRKVESRLMSCASLAQITCRRPVAQR